MKVIKVEVLNTSNKMFTCTCAMTPTPVSLMITEPNIKGKESDNQYLTQNSKLSGTFGPCKMVPTASSPSGGPCTMALTVWEKTSDKITVSGSNVLTNKSQIKCGLGGTVKPFGLPSK